MTDRDAVLIATGRSANVYHDPDPEAPTRPNCERASLDARWVPRDPARLPERYTYCQYCNPDIDVKARRHHQSELAATLRATDPDAVGGDGRPVPDGGQPVHGREPPDFDDELTEEQREMLERVREESETLAPYAESFLEYYGELEDSEVDGS